MTVCISGCVEKNNKMEDPALKDVICGILVRS